MTDTITVTDINGIIVFEAVVKMDHDLYDTGFVKAVQIDDAPEWEVLVCGNNIKQGSNFYLDYRDDKIIQIRFDDAPDDINKIIDDYR